MTWILVWVGIFGGGLLLALLLISVSWRGVFRSYPHETRDAAAVFWAQHSSSHG